MPKNHERIIVGIDIGTTKICTVVAEVGRGREINVLGAGVADSHGISKGMVVDLAATVRSIAYSIERAERLSGCKIGSAYVGVSGNHITSLNSRGVVAVSRVDRVISQEDVARAVEASRAMSIPPHREVLHVIPRSFVIDGQTGVRDPLGMSGFRLEVETHIVTGSISSLHNIMRCVQRAGVEVDDLVLQPLASAEAVLTEEEKQLGVVLIDVGGGTTDVAVYIEGSVWHTSVLPVGGYQLSNDLSIVMQVPFEVAEQLKLNYGRVAQPRRREVAASPVEYEYDYDYGAAANNEAQVGGVDKHNVQAQLMQILGDSRPVIPEDYYSAEEYIEVDTFDVGRKADVPRSLITQVLEARLDEMFSMVAAEIRRSGYDGLLPAGVVLTGGGAKMPGIAAFAEQALKMPVRISSPQGLSGLAETLDSPAFTSGAGLAMLAGRRPDGILTTPVSSPQPQIRHTGGPNGNGDRFSKVRGFLREFLP